jgi:hypothetical protein
MTIADRRTSKTPAAIFLAAVIFAVTAGLCPFLLGCDTPSTAGGTGIVYPSNGDTIAYAADTALIRAILDSNGLTTTQARDVALFDSSWRASVLDLSMVSGTVTRLPAQIGELAHLTELNLSYQLQLKTLPAEIGQLSQLTTLNASHSGIKNIANPVFNCSLLVTLDLFNDSLTALPYTIGRLQHLSKLQIEYNQLPDLPDSIVRLSVPGQWTNVDGNKLCALDSVKTSWLGLHSYDSNWLQYQVGCP